MARQNKISIQNQNRNLRRQIKNIQSRISERALSVENSLSSLVEAASIQSNLTSLNPVIQNNLYVPLTLNWPILSYMYKTHGIIQAAIDMPVQDALRGGIDIRSSELSHDDIKAMQDFIEEAGIMDIFAEASNWRRLYGGGALIINTNQDPEGPLTVKEMKSLEFYAADRWELQSPGSNVGQRVDWKSLGFGVPSDSEHFMFYGQKVHRSRVLTMPGKSAPHLIRWQLQGWGLSELEKMLEPFNTSLRLDNVIYELLKEAKVDVMRLDGFNDQLITAAGTSALRKRAALASEMKDYSNTLLMDTKDEFDQKTLTFGGLSEMAKINMTKLASALRIPEAKLYGQGASGFSSGEDSIENYNCMVESEVRRPMRRPIRKILNLVSQVMFGEVFDFDFDFSPLRIMSSTDEETVKSSKQNRTVQLFGLGILNAQEAAEQLAHDKLIGADTAVAQGATPEPPGQTAGMDDEPLAKDKGKKTEDDGESEN